MSQNQPSTQQNNQPGQQGQQNQQPRMQPPPNPMRLELINAAAQMRKWSSQLARVNSEDAKNISKSLAAYAVGIDKVTHA